MDFTEIRNLSNAQLDALCTAVMLEQNRRLELRLDAQEACNQRLAESLSTSRY